MIRVTFHILILCMALLFLLSCSRSEDETERLLQTLFELQSQVEARESRQVLRFLDKGFIAQGRYRTFQLGQMMALQFRQNQKILLFLKNTEIDMRDPQADVTVSAYVLGSDNIIPDRGQRYEVKMRWLKINDQWKLSRLNGQRATGNGQQ